ncbi:hypothetical protein Tco_1176575 [Tanacetum coccineum]
MFLGDGSQEDVGASTVWGECSNSKLNGCHIKQLGPDVETGFHGVQVDKHVWFEVELQGTQRNREVEVFQDNNDDTKVAQRRLEDKQLEERTNTDCLVKE